MLNLNDKDRREWSRTHGRVASKVQNFKLQVEADIFLSREDLIFSAHLNGKSMQSKDGQAVRKWLEQQLEDACALVWIPVICVLDAEPRNCTYNTRKLQLHDVSVDINRFYVAALPDGSVRSVDWEVSEAERLTAHGGPYAWVGHEAKTMMVDGKVRLPQHDEHLHLLPYTEALWAGLNELMTGIDRLRIRLHVMLRSDAGLAKLNTVGAQMLKLLGEGEPEKINANENT
jgi:hypothetical protein